ncbi:hypothetical protein ACIHFC_11375 [Streptomyces sp. NPDC052013]|uniref:hypothetical protein n=1 Tax=Streptomyces sp. NPDC052013 TaxID=3365679 RepID=UPI0037D50A6B
MSNPYQRIEERHGGRNGDGTGGLKQIDHGSSDQGHPKQPRTDFHSSVHDFGGRPSTDHHDHKSSTDSGIGGHRT